jgi:hypothetical protein
MNSNPDLQLTPAGKYQINQTISDYYILVEKPLPESGWA